MTMTMATRSVLASLGPSSERTPQFPAARRDSRKVKNDEELEEDWGNHKVILRCLWGGPTRGEEGAGRLG